MSSLASKVIQIALNEEGYLEKKSNSQLDSKTDNAGSSNYTKYARDLDNISGFYNGKKNGFAWCDMFVDWCFVQAFGVAKAKELLCQPNNSAGAGCTYSAQYYRNKGQFHTSNPKVGDQIFFGVIGNFSHTGLVYKVDATKVYTIEGNTSSAAGVVANGGCVRTKSYALNYSKIGGYGRPAYDAESGTISTPVVSTPVSTPTTSKPQVAKYKSTGVAGTYKVTATSLRLRLGAGTNFDILTDMPNGTTVICYGYYNKDSSGTNWLYVVANVNGKSFTGYCSSKYLQRV